MPEYTKATDGVPYEGPTGITRDSDWLTSEDLPYHRDTIVTIEQALHYDEVEFPRQPKQFNKIGIRFVGKQKILLVNRTNQRTLNALAEDNMTGSWRGMTIALYVEPDIMVGGKRVPAIRIRPHLPTHPSQEMEAED